MYIKHCLTCKALFKALQMSQRHVGPQLYTQVSLNYVCIEVFAELFVSE